MSYMVKIFMARILSGNKTLEQVPESNGWRADTKDAVVAYYVGKVTSGEMSLEDVPDSPDTWRTWVEEEIVNNEGSEVNGSDS